jgi:hypothetical protein
MEQGGIGQRRHQRDSSEQLKHEQKIFPQQPAEPGAESALLEHALPEKQCRRVDSQPPGFEAMEKEDQRDRSGKQQQRGGHSPKHRSPYAAHLPEHL